MTSHPRLLGSVLATHRVRLHKGGTDAHGLQFRVVLPCPSRDETPNQHDHSDRETDDCGRENRDPHVSSHDAPSSRVASQWQNAPTATKAVQAAPTTIGTLTGNGACPSRVSIGDVTQPRNIPAQPATDATAASTRCLMTSPHGGGPRTRHEQPAEP